MTRSRLFHKALRFSLPAWPALAALLAAGLLVLLASPLPGARAAGPFLVDQDAPGPTHDGLSWTTAYTGVQAALAVATAGEEIWVAEGVYVPGSARADTFQLKTGVVLYGGFGGYGSDETQRAQRDWAAHVTVLSGDLGRDDLVDPNGVVTTTANIVGGNAYHVVTGSDPDATAVLDGFTITGGSADGPIFPATVVGGGLVNAGGNPSLSNLTFSGNRAGSSGGGIFNDSNPTLVGVVFTGNSATEGGGMLNQGGSPRLTGVTFSSNSVIGDGGGLYNNNASPELTDVVFSGNSAPDGGGGGIFSIDGDGRLTHVTFISNTANYAAGMDINHSSPLLTDVTFRGNVADYSGGGLYIFRYSSPTLANVTLSGNSALSGNGGGMNNDDNASPTLVNVTFSGNSAGRAGGGMYNYEHSNPALSNCILWGNVAPSGSQILSEEHSTSSIIYSLIQGGYSGTSNLAANPLFVDADGPDSIYGTPDDDLRLQATSPAIDAGDNSAVPADAADLDGDGNTAEPLSFDLAGNPRFLDVTSRLDTGHGLAPIVDMGAYEAAYDLAYADLTIVKSVIPAAAAPGQIITYTLAFTNGGPQSSQAVIDDAIPVSMTNTSVASSGVPIAQLGPGIWSVPDLAPGVSGIITLTGVLSRPLAAGMFTNTATIAGSAVDSGTLDNTASAAVAVSNAAPVAGDDGYSVDEDLVLAVSAPGVLGNDSDDNADSLTAILADNVLIGTLVLSPTGGFAYTPALNFSGLVTFTYRASDGADLSNLAMVTIAVVDPDSYSYLPIILKNGTP